uniref:Zinc finger family protein n=1 Tax=Solanum tuberosum TaxID=4113 RepID=M1B6B4_SOLTU
MEAYDMPEEDIEESFVLLQLHSALLDLALAADMKPLAGSCPFPYSSPCPYSFPLLSCIAGFQDTSQGPSCIQWPSSAVKQL